MTLQRLLQRAKNEVGISTLAHASRDVHILLLTRSIRMFAYGSSTLVLALYFAQLGLSDTKIGLFMTLTLIGDVGLSLLLTLVADSLGRRKILVVGGILMAVSGVVFAIATNYWLLLLVAVVGVISPSGNEIGPFKAIEESTLAHLSDAKSRSDIFAFHVVFGTLGGAGGFLAGGWITQALQTAGWSEGASFRLIFWIYAAAGLTKAALTALLSSKCEVQPVPAGRPSGQAQSEETESFLPDTSQSTAPPRKTSSISSISSKSRRTLLKLCSLFFFDSLASGMCPNSLIAFFLSRKFNLPEGQLGSIIASAQLISSIGNLFASAIAKRIGFVKTMVFTHLPSAIFLSLMPLPASLWLTITLLVSRASLNAMDQAPRSAFLAAVVLPDERTAVMGIVNTVKTMSQSSGPFLTGSLAESGRFWIAFVFAGALKAAYDVGLLTLFLHTKLEGDSSRVSNDARLQNAEQDLDDAQERNSEHEHLGLR